MRNSFVFVLLIGAGMPQAFAQTNESPPPPPKDVLPPIDLIRSPRARTASAASSRRSIYLTGRVLLDSGTPPPDPVPIECTCNGRTRIETYTDTKGNFSFRLGQNEGSVQDASIDLTMARIGGFAGSPVDCQVSARLAGYRSDALDISNRQSTDSAKIGTIMLRPISKSGGASVSLSSLRAPEKARKAYQDGMRLADQGKPVRARKLLEKAVNLYPNYAAAWCELGLLQQNANQDEEARRSLARSVAADPNFVRPYLLLSTLAWKHNAWQIMADSSSRALRLDPLGHPEARTPDIPLT